MGKKKQQINGERERERQTAGRDGKKSLFSSLSLSLPYIFFSDHHHTGEEEGGKN